MKKFFPLLSFLFLGTMVFGQDLNQDLVDFNLERNKLNQKGMTVLASWSVLNIAWSSTQLNNSDPLKQSYHQMNLGWNAVNLVIAGFGIYQAHKFSGDLTVWQSLEEQASIKRILAVNAALDLAYVASGFYLREYAFRADNFARYEGFGRAVIVNGAFLFGFDVLMYWVHHQHELKDLVPLMESLQVGPQSVGIRLSF